jgi:hypothetical protein
VAGLRAISSTSAAVTRQPMSSPRISHTIAWGGPSSC